MKDVYTIGEISRLYHIGPDSLRYYEELGLLTPTRGANGYRLYRLKDLWRLNVIRDMRELGFSMEQIGRYLSHRSLLSTKTLLCDELSAIDAKIAHYENLRENVAMRIATLENASTQEIDQVSLVSLPKRHCYLLHSGYQNDEQMDILMKKLLNRAPEDLYIIGNNRIGSVIPLSQLEAGHYQGYESVFIIDEKGDDILEEGLYLTVSYHGPSSRNNQYLPLLEKEAKNRSLKILGPCLELLWVDIHQSEDPHEHITELQLLCSP